jgi:hypothetical protein
MAAMKESRSGLVFVAVIDIILRNLLAPRAISSLVNFTVTSVLGRLMQPTV